MSETPVVEGTGGVSLDAGEQPCPVPVLGALDTTTRGATTVGTADSSSTSSLDVEDPDSATRMFSTSVMVSAVRCTLAYVVFPWVLPLLGLADAVGPWIGIPISLIAIGFNIASIRRFWKADHAWKWAISTINVCVIGLLSVLLVMDLSSLFSG